MKFNFKAIFLAAIASVSGLVVLLGYFVQLPLLVTTRDMLLSWATLLSAVALLVGVINLMRVHWAKVSSGHADLIYSVVTLLALVVTLGVGVVFGGPTSAASIWLFEYILIPIESSLMALLTVVLVFAIGRMFSRRVQVPSVVFVFVVLFLLASSFFLAGGPVPFLSDILQVGVVAGARGVLLGVVLGALTAGLRVLMGADRPYGG